MFDESRDVHVRHLLGVGDGGCGEEEAEKRSDSGVEEAKEVEVGVEVIMVGWW